MDRKNKAVLIKQNSFISDNYVYNLLGFNKNYLAASKKEELLEEYEQGGKLDEAGLSKEEFDTFEKYLNTFYDIYIDEKGVYTWKSDENWNIVDIDRDDDLMLVALMYNEVYIDGKVLNNVNDKLLLEKCNDKNSKYAVVYMERLTIKSQVLK